MDDIVDTGDVEVEEKEKVEVVLVIGFGLCLYCWTQIKSLEESSDSDGSRRISSLGIVFRCADLFSSHPRST